MIEDKTDGLIAINMKQSGKGTNLREVSGTVSSVNEPDSGTEVSGTVSSAKFLEQSPPRMKLICTKT